MGFLKQYNLEYCKKNKRKIHVMARSYRPHSLAKQGDNGLGSITMVVSKPGGVLPRFLYAGVPLGDREPHPSIRRISAEILTLF